MTSFDAAVNSILNEPSPPLAAPPVPFVVVPSVTPPIYPDPPPPAPSAQHVGKGFPPAPP
mgnify:CR=1 FL=1